MSEHAVDKILRLHFVRSGVIDDAVLPRCVHLDKRVSRRRIVFSEQCLIDVHIDNRLF